MALHPIILNEMDRTAHEAADATEAFLDALAQPIPPTRSALSELLKTLEARVITLRRKVDGAVPSRMEHDTEA